MRKVIIDGTCLGALVGIFLGLLVVLGLFATDAFSLLKISRQENMEDAAKITGIMGGLGFGALIGTIIGSTRVILEALENKTSSPATTASSVQGSRS